jgi:transposase-like protein
MPALGPDKRPRESAELKRLRRQNTELRRGNSILKTASSNSARQRNSA